MLGKEIRALMKFNKLNQHLVSKVMVYTYCSGELMSSIGSLLVLEGSDEPHCAGGF